MLSNKVIITVASVAAVLTAVGITNTVRTGSPIRFNVSSKAKVKADANAAERKRAEENLTRAEERVAAAAERARATEKRESDARAKKTEELRDARAWKLLRAEEAECRKKAEDARRKLEEAQREFAEVDAAADSAEEARSAARAAVREAVDSVRGVIGRVIIKDDKGVLHNPRGGVLSKKRTAAFEQARRELAEAREEVARRETDVRRVLTTRQEADSKVERARVALEQAEAKVKAKKLGADAVQEIEERAYAGMDAAAPAPKE